MLKKSLIVVLVVGVAYGGFRWGGSVFSPLERALGIDPSVPAEAAPQPTPEMAEETLDRIERFRAGELGDRLALSSLELTAVVRYALPGLLPAGVTEPTVRLDDGKVNVGARVAVESFPELPRLDPVIGFLPDTLLIEMRGSLVPLDQRFLALVVDRVSAAKIPLPGRMLPDVLSGLGRDGPAALPEDGLQVPRPDGIETIFVQRDSLILLAQAPAGTGGGEGN